MRSLAFALALAGCAGHIDGARYNADGSVDHQVAIGWPVPWSVAEARAAEVCPNGFTVLSKLHAEQLRQMYYKCK